MYSNHSVMHSTIKGQQYRQQKVEVLPERLPPSLAICPIKTVFVPLLASLWRRRCLEHCVQHHVVQPSSQ